MIDTVASNWRKTGSRLVRMSWDELHTRVRQEASKRWDLALYQIGMPAGENGLAKSLSTAKLPVSSRFFFTSDDVTGRSQLLLKSLPSEVEALIREADEICQHRFRLLGYDNLDYGAEIDWHLDAIHKKRAPLKPWHKIHFLDFEEVGDHKVIWELNRHQHLVVLAKAQLVTGEDRYVTELMKQWYSWQAANPYPMGINWGSSLEVAFRTLSWLWVRTLMAKCPAVPDSFEADLSRALSLNGRYIEKYLSTYFSPNTHLLGEAVALFFIGTLCPEIESAERWRDEGWRIVLQEADRQVRPDGVYFEQSLYYHAYALDFFLHARLLATRNDMNVPSSFDQTLQKMLDVVRAVSQTGVAECFGDDDGGRLFNPRRNRTEHLTDPLATGAVLFQRNDLRSTASLTEECLWLFGEEATSYFAKNAISSRPEIKSASFGAGGIYVLTSSEKCTQQMVVDAGPQGIGHSGHGHADALHVSVSINGRRWLVDSGAFCYMCDQRDEFRGTGAHNTLRVDGQDQAISEGPFAWSSLPAVHADRWIEGKTFALFAGSHNGYSRLPDPVIHRRFIFYLHGSFWLVRDVVEGRKPHQLETFWHFASDLKVAKTEHAFIAQPSQSSPDDIRLALLPVQDSGLTSELKTGFASPAYGKKEPAMFLVSSARIQLPASHATLVTPLLHASDKPGMFREITPKSSAGGGARAYRYDDLGKSYLMVFANGEKSWDFGKWNSDASFLFCGMENGRIIHLIVCGGSSVKLQGKLILAHNSKVERFEWTKSSGSRQIFSSDETAIQAFSEGELEACDSVF